ncbi:hypothetical protein [Streptomyces boluensis]|uniref:Uncharacterized protein n=1 Tax=Streptomyces boluensis TaxID=1775135 RepID=A0A964XKG2_9ACTN|nr:hypothetical protein [Streptomyces boluensis]NBE50513.1 hypothetical protein [Streptomyces boluensis]
MAVSGAARATAWIVAVVAGRASVGLIVAGRDGIAAAGDVRDNALGDGSERR